MGFITNDGRLITMPLEMVGNANFYLQLDRDEKLLKIYKRNNDFEAVKAYYPLDENFDVNNDVPFEIFDEIPCIFGGEEGSQTPKGIFKIKNVSEKNKEFVSGFNPNHEKVKFYGYIEIYEYYWIHSNMYVGESINSNNFRNHPENLVHGAQNKDGSEHTSGCIRIPNQNKLDELLEIISPGDIVNTL